MHQHWPKTRRAKLHIFLDKNSKLEFQSKDTVLTQNLTSFAAEISVPNDKNFTLQRSEKKNPSWKGAGERMEVAVRENMSLQLFE